MQICMTLQSWMMDSKHPATYEEKFHERTRQSAASHRR
jgi:hypothetical protein